MTPTRRSRDRPPSGLASAADGAAAPAGARAPSGHPTERPPRGIEPLRDPDVADWIESNDRAALFFWDESDAVSQRQRGRVELAAAAAGIPVGVVDVRMDALVAQALGVKSVPMLVVFRAGEVVERLIGAAPEEILAAALAHEPHPSR